MSTPAINRTLETAAHRATLAKARAVAPDVAFATHFLTAASRHQLLCVFGVVEQIREIMADGAALAASDPAAEPAVASGGACGSGGCSACAGGGESPQQRRAVCLAVLDHLYSGEPTGKPELDAFHAVATRQRLPRELFNQLVEGLYQWQTTRRCATWNKLLDLCQQTGGVAALIAFRSMLAPTVGESLTLKETSRILALGGALRLAWALQRVGADVNAQRQLLPMDDLVKFGVLESSLRRFAEAGTSGGDPAWRALMDFEAQRALNLYRGGCGALDLLHPRDKKAVAIAGEATCERLEELRTGACDGLSTSPRPAPGFWGRLRRIPAALKRLDEQRQSTPA